MQVGLGGRKGGRGEDEEEEEGQEDKMAWEGLSPNQSICFLVCPPGWPLAPARLLHSAQHKQTHKRAHTNQHSCSDDSWNRGLMCFHQKYIYDCKSVTFSNKAATSPQKERVI